MMMNFETALFYALATALVGLAIAVISVKNAVHAALCLVGAFFTSACLWLLAEAEFLAISLVLVYVGAVMVLFLFVVMMLDVKHEPLREGFIRYLPVGLLVAAIMLLEIVGLIGWSALKEKPLGQAVSAEPNIKWLGKSLFSDYLLPFEIAAVILTVAIIAAIALTLRKRSGTKSQDPSGQVLVTKEDRLKLVKMAAETGREEKP